MCPVGRAPERSLVPAMAPRNGGIVSIAALPSAKVDKYASRYPDFCENTLLGVEYVGVLAEMVDQLVKALQAQFHSVKSEPSKPSGCRSATAPALAAPASAAATSIAAASATTTTPSVPICGDRITEECIFEFAKAVLPCATPGIPNVNGDVPLTMHSLLDEETVAHVVLTYEKALALVYAAVSMT